MPATTRTERNKLYYSRHRLDVRAQQMAHRRADRGTVYYICGPISHVEDANRASFNAAEKSLIAKGYRVINPINHDAEIGILPGTTLTEPEYNDVLRWDLRKIINKCTHMLV